MGNETCLLLAVNEISFASIKHLETLNKQVSQLIMSGPIIPSLWQSTIVFANEDFNELLIAIGGNPSS